MATRSGSRRCNPVLDGGVTDDVEGLAGFFERAEPELPRHLAASENATLVGKPKALLGQMS